MATKSMPRLVLGLCACLLALTAHAQMPEASTAPVRRIVDVEGRRFQVAEVGQGGPTVVFVSGLGEGLDTWAKVQPAAARFARTLSYNRAGLGGSDSASGPRTLAALADELHRLLQAAANAAQYLLVGHSLGGAIVAEFALRYPTEVAALLLVDPEDQRLLDRLSKRLPASLWAERQWAIERASSQLTAPVRAEMLGMSHSPTPPAGCLPPVPTLLISGTKKNPEFPGNPLEQDLKVEIQREDLRQMPRAWHLLVPESRHYIQNDAPDVVIAAIRVLAVLSH